MNRCPCCGSLFSGIGGLELGLEWAGVGHTAWQVEMDPFCRSVLAKHWPNVERHVDVREVGAASLARVDLICGGFPCQDVSSAGARRGLAGKRSGLWFEYRRIVDELRPAWVVVENVTSGKKLWLPQVRADLEQLGYGVRAVTRVTTAIPHDWVTISVDTVEDWTTATWAQCARCGRVRRDEHYVAEDMGVKEATREWVRGVESPAADCARGDMTEERAAMAPTTNEERARAFVQGLLASAYPIQRTTIASLAALLDEAEARGEARGRSDSSGEGQGGGGSR